MRICNQLGIYTNKKKKTAAITRATWLEEVATARAADGNLSIAQEIRNLTTRENQRRDSRMIKGSLAATQRKALSLIEVQSPDGSWVELFEQSDIENALHAELANRFNQAAGTPFCQEPLLSDIGPYATTPAVQQILRATYTPDPSVDSWARQLIPFLKQEVTMEPPQYQSVQQHNAGWKKVKERTSAGPSGITIPHMKAHGQSLLLSNIDTMMANLPYVHGFSPDRWRKGLDVMLEKKPGVRKINTLRAILLYEADFNQNNKRLGREMLFRAETAQAVAQEQFGSRKNLSATDQSLNKALTFDIWRQLRQNGALCSNDAKSCYDRIVHNCASLCMQRVGTPTLPIVSMLSTIQQLSHHVRTVFGESQHGYCHRGSIPIQGVGQGNGAGPQIWALVSSPVLNMLRSKGLGARFVSSVLQHQTDLVGYAFVDDTDLVVSKPDISISDVNTLMQDSLTAWEGGIRATGGAIVPEKSHWYLVEFGWKDGSPFYKTVHDSPGKLKVNDVHGHPQRLHQLEPWEAVCTLGVRLAPDGNMTAQFDHMVSVATQWADSLRAGHLPRHLTWTAWRTTILKTLEYPLPVTTLTRTQCSRITSIVAAAALPRCGIMRTFPRALLHAPIKYGGLNIPDLYVEQGIQHIVRLIRYSKTQKHSTGILLRHSCEHFKVQMGCNGPIFSLPLILDVLATPGWVSHTWRFVQEYGIEIHDDIPDFVPPRLGDQLLIPLFSSHGFHGPELGLLNQCRLFLRVLWLSDLTTADGCYFERHAIFPPVSSSCKRNYFFPYQGYSSQTAWSLWKRATRLLCFADQPTKLKNPLGPWRERKEIRWWYDARTQRLYDASEKSVGEFSLTGRSNMRAASKMFSKIGHVESVPSSAQPASAHEHSPNQVRLTGVGEFLPATPANTDPCAWILDNIHFSPGFLALVQQDQGLVAVSDGSYKEGHGTTAWILYASESFNCIGRVVVPGQSQDQSAYRSELTGLYAIAVSILFLERKFHVKRKVTVGCDGLSALRQVSKTFDFIDPSMPQYDLILATQLLVNKSNWEWKWQHVKGHQDDVASITSLDLLSQLSIRMDLEAKCHWAATAGQKIAVDIDGEPWRVSLDGHKVTSQLRESLRQFIYSKTALDYWDGKQRFKSVQTIDWESFGAAMRSSSATTQRWISRTTSGFCATGVMMHRRKERKTPNCPRCGQVEDVQHIWLCKHDTSKIWEKALANLCTWMTAQGTHPDVTTNIIKGLSGWQSGMPASLVSAAPWIQEALVRQEESGWRNFFEGFVVVDWRTAQNRYYAHIGSRRSSRRWVSALIRKMWQIAWDLWEHRNGYLQNEENNMMSSEVNQNILADFQ